MSNYRKTMADALREMYPLTEETQLDEGVFDPKDGEKWAKEIQKGIKAPVVDVKTSSLGGEERMSIMVKFSMEKEASKGGTAFFNSRYANVRVDIDGSMEMFQASHKFGIKKMRKAKIKSAKDVIKNINDWIVKVPALKEEVDLDEALKVGQKVKVKDKGKVVSGVITNVGKGQTLGVADVKLPDGRINVYGTDEINEEVDLDEAILKDRDYEVDEKEGVVKISKKNFAKVSKDAKGTDKSKPTMMVLTKKGTSLYPVKFTEEVDLDEDASNFKSAVARIKKAKSAKDLKKLEKSFERVYKQTGALTDKEFGQLDDMISDKLVKLGEEVDLDKLPDMRDALRQVRAEEVDLDEVDRSSYKDRIKKLTAMLKDAEKEKPLDKEWIKLLKRRIKSESDDERKKLGIRRNNREEADLDEAKGTTKYVVMQGPGDNNQKVIATFDGGPKALEKAKKFRDDWNKKNKSKIKLNKKGKPIAAHMARIFDKGVETSYKVGDKVSYSAFAPSIIKDEVELDEGKMSQLHQYIKDKKSPEEIAKLMKLDVKTIKSLMSSHHPEEVEESAASDARRAMRRDKDFSRRDSADDDTDATADDVKGASKNIMMQMRKAQSLNGRFDVEFGDGKKVKIPAKMAMAVQSKYNKMRRPAEKEKFQAKVGKSYRDMLSALKEEVKPKKESVLDRIDRKIKEKNDG
jgi:hypothetical protein